MEAAVRVDGLLKVFDVPEREPGLVAAAKGLVRARPVKCVPSTRSRSPLRRARSSASSARTAREDDHAQDALRPALSERRGGARARLRAVKAAAWLPEPDHARDGEPEPAAVGLARTRLVRVEPSDLPDPRGPVRPDARRAIEPFDIGDLVRKPVRQLSLGERMKAEIVGALLHRPQVLFLDEPTIGLDVTMQKRIRGFVADYNERYGATVC